MESCLHILFKIADERINWLHWTHTFTPTATTTPLKNRVPHKTTQPTALNSRYFAPNYLPSHKTSHSHTYPLKPSLHSRKTMLLVLLYLFKHDARQHFPSIYFTPRPQNPIPSFHLSAFSESCLFFANYKIMPLRWKATLTHTHTHTPDTYHQRRRRREGVKSN